MSSGRNKGVVVVSDSEDESGSAAPQTAAARSNARVGASARAPNVSAGQAALSDDDDAVAEELAMARRAIERNRVAAAAKKSESTKSANKEGGSGGGAGGSGGLASRFQQHRAAALKDGGKHSATSLSSSADEEDEEAVAVVSTTRGSSKATAAVPARQGSSSSSGGGARNSGAGASATTGDGAGSKSDLRHMFARMPPPPPPPPPAALRGAASSAAAAPAAGPAAAATGRGQQSPPRKRAKQDSAVAFSESAFDSMQSVSALPRSSSSGGGGSSSLGAHGGVQAGAGAVKVKGSGKGGHQASDALLLPLPAADASWPDKHAPRRLEDLSLHVNKVADVRGWLEGAVAGCRACVEEAAARTAILSRQTSTSSATTAFSGPVEIDAEELREIQAALEAADSRSSMASASGGAGAGGGGAGGGAGGSSRSSLPPPAIVQQPFMLPLGPPPRLLILAGPPGIGKSTAVRLMCAALGVRVREWVDPAARGGGGGTGAGAGTAGFRGGTSAFKKRGAYGSSGGGGYADADDDTSAADAGETMRQLYNRAQWRKEEGSHQLLGAGKALGATTALEDFRSFLGAAQLFKSLTLVTAGGAHGRGAGVAATAPAAAAATVVDPSAPHILLIEDLPRSHFDGDTVMRRQLGEIFLSFLRTSRVPAVLIASEGEAPGDAVSRPALERMLGKEVMNHPSCTFIEVPATPEGRLRKVLTTALNAEKLPAVLQGTEGTQPIVLTDLVETIIASARGDVRHALMSLQFSCIAALRGEKTTSTRSGSIKVRINRPAGTVAPTKIMRNADGEIITSGGGSGDADGAAAAATAAVRLCGRDDFIEVLHLLGKLLYAKRLPSTVAPDGSVVGEPRGELDTNPDTLMSTSPYDAAATGLFLAENCPAYHTDIGDLAAALDTLSLADVVIGASDRVSQTGTAARGARQLNAEQCAAALVGRAVSTHNRSPAPAGFRPVRKPGAFAVARIRAANARWLSEEGLGLGIPSPATATAAPTAPTSAAAAAAAPVGGEQYDADLEAVNDAIQAMTRTGAQAAAHNFNLLSFRQRVLDVLPAVGIMFRCSPQARAGAGGAAGGAGGAGGTASARVFTPRAEALLLASCFYGLPRGKTTDGDCVSLVGRPLSAADAATRAALSAPASGSSGSSGTGSSGYLGRASSSSTVASDDADAVGGQPARRDETDDGVEAERVDAADSDTAATAVGASITAAQSATAVLGAWQAFAAARGVDLWQKQEKSAHRSAPASFAGLRGMIRPSAGKSVQPASGSAAVDEIED